MLFGANVKKNKQISMSENDKKLFGIEKLNIKRSPIPAVTHVDYSARIQTVNEETNIINIINFLKNLKRYGLSFLVNTSFNVRGEPIVCSIEDSFRCFHGNKFDILVCENFILYKKNKIKNF